MSEPRDLVCIHWRIGNGSGHGQPIERKLAEEWIESMNAAYGDGTHWVEPVAVAEEPEPTRDGGAQ